MTAVALKRTRTAGAVCGLLLLLLLLLPVAVCLAVRATVAAVVVLLVSVLLACSSVLARLLPALRGLQAVRRVTSDVMCEYRSVQAASHASCRCKACCVTTAVVYQCFSKYFVVAPVLAVVSSICTLQRMQRCS
jgi:hypothetical protein